MNKAYYLVFCALLVSSSSYGSDCDPKLEQACSIELCTEPTLSLGSTEEINAIRKKEGLKPYEKSENVKILENFNAELVKTDASRITNEFLQDPVSNYSFYKGLIDFAVKPAPTKESPDKVIFNSMIPISDDLKGKYSEFKDIEDFISFATSLKDFSTPIGEKRDFSIFKAFSYLEKKKAQELEVSFNKFAELDGMDDVQRTKFKPLIDWFKDFSKVSKNDKQNIPVLFNQLISEKIRKKHEETLLKFSDLALVGMKSAMKSASDTFNYKCNLMDFYTQKANRLHKDGVLKRWEKNATQGALNIVLPHFSKKDQEKLKKEFKRCKVSYKPFDSIKNAQDGGLISSQDFFKKFGMAGAALTSCEVNSGIFDRFEDTLTEVNILISPTTLAYNAEGVLSHEVGHCLDRMISTIQLEEQSRSKYKKLQECLSSMHEGKNQYLAEDFADWFAASLPNDSLNVGCHLNSLIGGKPTFKSDERDSHSSILFRTIHILKVKGKTLPNSCVEMLKDSNEEIKKCSF